LPALMFGLLSIWLFHRLVLAATQNPQTALLSALMLALAPPHIHYSNEARGYTLLICLVLIMLLAIYEDHPAWFLLGTLAAYTHVYGFIYLAVLGCIAIPRMLKSKLWVITLMTSAVLSALWLPIALYQSSDVADGFWLRPLTVPGILWYLPTSTILSPTPTIISLVALIFSIIITVRALKYYWKNRTSELTTIAIVWVAVPVLIATISFTWHNVYLARALLPAGVLIVALWAVYLVAETPQYRKMMIAVLIVGSIVESTSPTRQNLRDYMSECEGTDYIYVLSNHVAMIASYYSGDRPVYVWPRANDTSQYLTEPAKQTLWSLANYSDLPPGNVCIPYLDDWLETENKLQQRNNIILGNQYEEVTLAGLISEFHRYVIYKVENEQQSLRN